MSKRIAIAVAAMTAVPASAQITTLFTGQAGLPTSQVPGAPGQVFNDSATSRTVFDRPYVSPDGTFVGFKGDLEASPFFDDAIVVFPLANPSAGVSFVESTPVPGAGGSGLLSNAFDRRVSVRNDGAFAFVTNSRVNGGLPSQGDNLVTYDPTTMSFTTALAPGSSFGGETIAADTSIGSPYISSTGGIGAQVVLDTTGEAVVFESTVFASEGQQPTGAPAPTSVFASQTTYFSNDGQGYLTQAVSFPPSNTIETTVLDGNTVINGGATLPGSSFLSPVSDTSPADNGAGMNEAGVWWARGSNQDGTEWAVVDGALVAVEGDSAFGTSETWVEINGVAADSLGNYIVMGETSTDDDVLVYNGSLLLARSGDAIDLPGYALRDGGLFDFEPNDIALSDTGTAIFVARLTQNGSNAGAALLSVAIPEPTTGLALAGTAGLLLRRRRS